MMELERLRSSRDFKRVYRRGRSYAHPLFVLYILRVEEKRKRIGFSVSKKCGGAVVRNRIKRRLREICRQHEAMFRPGFDAVIIARKSSGSESWQEYCQVLDELFRKSRMFLREEQMDMEG